MLIEAGIGIATLLAAIFIGLPYYEAHKRRKELARKNLGRKAQIADERTLSGRT